MKNPLIVSVIILMMIACYLLEQSIVVKKSQEIALIVPLEHEAMDQIISGFKEVLKPTNFQLQVKNSQGDINIQRALIDLVIRQKKDVIATIGTDATLMAMNRAHDQLIIGVDVTEQVDQSLSDNVTGIAELSIAPSYQLSKMLFPHLHKIAFIYSSTDRNFQMVDKFCALAASDNIEVQKIMVQSISELYLLAKSIDSDVDLIFIGKDHLVASGAPALSQVAKKLNIPLMTCDEGSIKAGGTFALGNREKDIGKASAELAIALLSGQKPSDIAIKPIQAKTLFINRNRLQNSSIDIDYLQHITKKLHLDIEMIEGL